MQRDRAEPGLRAPSVAVVKRAAPLSLSPRTTLPVCHELPALPVLAEKAAWVEPQVTARLSTSPTGTATGSTVRRAREARLCTATPSAAAERSDLRFSTPGHRHRGPSPEEPGGTGSPDRVGALDSALARGPAGGTPRPSAERSGRTPAPRAGPGCGRASRGARLRGARPAKTPPR